MRSAASSEPVGVVKAAGSTRWRLFFRMMFAAGPLFAFVRRRRPLPPVEELLIVGRRSGVERSVLLQLVEANDRTYVIEPSGLRSSWAQNLRAAGRAELVYRDGRRTGVVADELAAGAERDAALHAQPDNQPPPMRVLYRRAHRHIHEVGRVFRLEPAPPAPDLPPPVQTAAMYGR